VIYFTVDTYLPRKNKQIPTVKISLRLLKNKIYYKIFLEKVNGIGFSDLFYAIGKVGQLKIPEYLSIDLF